MNKRLIFAILFLLGVSQSWGQTVNEPLDQMIERGLGRAGEQALILADNLKDKPEALPKTFEKGELKFTSYRGWVSGFFPGELWLLYEATGNADYEALAQVFTERVEPAKKMTSTHDLGFMLYCSYGNGWLRSGYTGNQIRMAETYINTGSLYLCTAAFLPLGLPETDPFWASPYREWTAKKAWNGIDVGADHHL